MTYELLVCAIWLIGIPVAGYLMECVERVNIVFREVRSWPGDVTPPNRRKRSLFKASVDVVGRAREELRRLGAARATISGYWSHAQLKRDGAGPYADARPVSPGIVLEWERGSTQYRLAGDRFLTWQDNLHAITAILEGIRKMERYGVSSGQLLEGFRALPAKAGEHVMTEEDAAFLLAADEDVIAAAILSDRRLVEVYARVRRAEWHPDNVSTGNPEKFVSIEKAVAVLAAAT